MAELLFWGNGLCGLAIVVLMIGGALRETDLDSKHYRSPQDQLPKAKERRTTRRMLCLYACMGFYFVYHAYPGYSPETVAKREMDKLVEAYESGNAWDQLKLAVYEYKKAKPAINWGERDQRESW